MFKKFILVVMLCSAFGVVNASASWFGDVWENIKRESTNAVHGIEVNGKSLFNDVGEILDKVLCDDGTCCCIKKSGNN
ncbi:MAG: hypothetical protein LBT18_05560 [Endomicrobium sp.]|jgi:hypothetical protein|nr:hypothetical protein [Endomicrobium sp.]